MNVGLQVLDPVSVPWKISPSVPYLTMGEAVVGFPLKITFVGCFLCFPPTGVEGEPSGTVHVAVPPGYQAFGGLDQSAAECQPARLIRTSFVGWVAARQRPAFSDSEVVRETDYDWSKVDTCLVPAGAIKQNLARFFTQWWESGKCPNPGLYEVVNSSWRRELGFMGSQFHHYLLLGHDDFIEVIATEWAWEAGEAVR